jgi:hypothetical protein
MLRVRLLFAAAAALIAITGLGVPTAAADTPSGSFTTLARADAFRVAVNSTSFAVSDITDTSGPTAQAKLDSVGDSEGFAAFPYPGDTATTTPGLITSIVASSAGLPPPQLPPYPLVANSQSPGQPDGNVTQGPISMAAHSSQQSSTGHASGAGADSGGNTLGKAVADSAVKVDDAGKLSSDASSTLESITIGGILRIGAMTASAHSEASPDGKPTTASSFRTEGVTIAGTPVGISDQGLVLAGSTQPLPDTSSLAQALKAAGIEVRPLKPMTQGGSMSSGGLFITAVQALPTGNTVTLTYTFGVVHAESSGQASPSSGATNTGSGAAAGTDTGSTSSAAPAGGAAGSAGGAGAVPAGDQGGGALAAIPGGAGSPAALSAPGSSPSAATRAPSGANTSNAAALGNLPVSTTSSLSVYLVLVVGAAVALSATFLFRIFAVRLAWIT